MAITSEINGVYIFTPSTDKPMRTKEELEQRKQMLYKKWDADLKKAKEGERVGGIRKPL